MRRNGALWTIRRRKCSILSSHIDISEVLGLVQHKYLSSGPDTQISTESVISNGKNASLRGRIKLFNSFTKSKELFTPLHANGLTVSFYSCGPTVYDYAHIGNFRAFLNYDILKRWLTYCGYQVHHVCNITDVDDKIITKMNQEGLSLEQLTKKYTDSFFEDLAILNIVPATQYPRATEYIQAIVDLIASLMSKNYAYQETGSVYFRIESFPTYGSMINYAVHTPRDLAGRSGPQERVSVDDKRNIKDFVLWKAYKPTDGDVVWDSPFGRGRPGWHIECSAMILSLLGESIDIHAGGVDLMFPHHSNEIAQSEAHSGQKMCNCWIHNGFVNINNEKMSKSLRNFKTLRDIVTSPLDARALRLMFISTHYRLIINFSVESLSHAKKTIQRIDALSALLRSKVARDSHTVALLIDDDIMKVTSRIEEAMCDDINTAAAVSLLLKFLWTIEKDIENISSQRAGGLINALTRLDSVFGLFYEPPREYFPSALDEQTIPIEVHAIAQKRASFKTMKMFKEADELRRQLLSDGYVIKDLSGGAFHISRAK